MSHEGDRIQIDGTVTALHRGRCDVTLTNGQVVRTALAGRLMQNKIRVVAGDRVSVEVVPGDLWRIVYRHK